MLWQLYALVYDALIALGPYQRMMESVAALLGASSRIMDLGCGTGNLALFLATSKQRQEETLHYLGIDSAKNMLLRSCRKNAKNSYRFVQADFLCSLPMTLGSVDCVVMINSFYTVADPTSLLEEIRRVLKVGGILIISTPKDRGSDWAIFAEHWKTASWRKRIVFPVVMIQLLLVWLFTLLINRRASEGSYIFYSAYRLRTCIQQADYEVVQLTETYAGQNWLLVARPLPRREDRQ